MSSKRRKRQKTSAEPVQAAPEPAQTKEQAPATRQGAERAKNMLISLVLVAVTFTVFLPGLGNEFVNYDDDYYIVNNYDVRHGLSWDGFVYAFTTPHGANWFPMTWLSWMLDYELFGMNPRAFHVTSVLIHGLAVFLLFHLLVRMTGAVGRSAFVAAVFAVHPLHVESVAWASERKDVLSALFWFLTTWAYVRYVERPTRLRYVWVPGLLALGLMSKPMLVTLPFVLLLLDVWPLHRLKEGGEWRFGRSRVWRLVIEKVPLFALVVVSSIITFLVQRAAGAVQSIETYSVGVRILNVLLSYVGYIGKAFWPAKLSIYYPHPGENVSLLLGLLAGLVLLGVTALVIVAMRARPYLAVGWFWYTGTLVPVIGLVQVGQQAMADRYTYIPYVGLSVMLAWGVDEMASRFGVPRLVPATLTLVCLLGLAVAATAQVRVWRDSMRLFEHALSVTRDNPLANINLGVAYLNAGRLEEAERRLKEAVRIDPGAAEAHAALGELYSKQQRHDEALEAFRAALRLDPESGQTHADLGRMMLDQGDVNQALLQLREAVNLEPKNPHALTNLGVALIQQGRFDEAIEHFRRAIDVEPDLAEAHNNWGVALVSQGKDDDAVEHFRRALASQPNYVEAYYGLGLVAAGQKDFETAANHYREAVSLAPGDAELRYRLGLALANLGRTEDAAAELRESIRLEPRAESHYSLGLALTELGRLGEAQSEFRIAIDLEPDHAEAHCGLGIALANAGDFRRATEHYRRALAIQPGYAAAHNSWGVALAGQGRIGEALDHFKKAIELQPDLAGAHLNYGRALVQQGSVAEAESHFRAAVRLDPDDADAHNDLGVFLAQRGELDEAVESFRRALRLRPDHPRVRQNLESTLAALRARQGSDR